MIIRPARQEDQTNLYKLFDDVIRHTFEKNGFGHMIEEIKEEYEDKLSVFRDHLDRDEIDTYMLIAEEQGQIYGCISLTPSSKLIHKCMQGKLDGIHEIGTVYVLPAYQGKGIGRSLFNEMVGELINRGYESCYFDCGYPSAQVIWKRIFGEPTYFLKDYWDEGGHHMVWHQRPSELKLCLQNRKK